MIRYGTMALALALAACGTKAPEEPTTQPGNAPAAVETPGIAAPPRPDATPSATPVALPTGITSCAAELGDGPAGKLADQCRSVSPATRPPCNAANSCAMIRAEIARSCSVIDDGTPVPGCADRPDGPRAAASVIEIYYAAIAARDYATAWQLWDGDGARSGKSLDAFARGFATTASTNVTTGTPGAIEGAAGSSLVTIPVTVRATLADGTAQRFAGSYVLRRVNQPRSQGWQLYSATLKPDRAVASTAPRHRAGQADLAIPSNLNASWSPALGKPDHADEPPPR